MNNNKIININKKSFIGIVIMLFALVIFAIAITYVIPKGTFGETINEDGEIITDYTKYIALPDKSGINIFKGLFGFILVLFTSDGLSLIMLSLFLLSIAGTFQIMSDSRGMDAIVRKLIKKFHKNKYLLLCLLTLIFMTFGSFFGLFEEVLTLLPLIVMITIYLGFDGYLGFLICIVGTGFGFASAITNPFTVITASNIIGASPMANLWYRFIVFALMYGLLMLFIYLHVRKINKHPELSPTFEADKKMQESKLEDKPIENENKISRTYIIFLSLVLVLIITITSIPALRGLTTVFLTAIFLIGGLISGLIAMGSVKETFKSFLKGVIACLPTILLVLLASSIKYILEEGMILATISHSISTLVVGKNIFVVALIIYAIILVLEFFISSSTAKSIFVMGILGCVSLELSKESIVLIYLFGDGFTNVLLPTSPVLLIGLSMVGMNYFTWLRKSKFLFLVNLILVILLMFGAILIGY